MKTYRLKAAVAGLAGSIALMSPPARAQAPGAVALDQLEPSAPGDPLFGVPSPSVGGHLVPRAAVVFDHAVEPFTLSDGSTERAVLKSQSLLHVSASFALWDRLLLSALLPVAVAQRGDGAAVPGEAAPAPTSPALGDLRLGVRIRLFGEDGDPVQLGAGFALHLPTGDDENFVGEGSVRDAPQLLLGGRIGDVVWSAAGGAMVRSSENPSTLTYGGGAALLLLDDRLQLGPEVYASTPIQGGSLPISATRRVEREQVTSAELLFGARVRLFGGLVLGAAAGPGLGDGFGTPSFRAVGSLAWAPPSANAADAEPPDPDEDGISTAEDACPYASGPTSTDPKRHGCPVEDRDDDGIPDPDDACPAQAGAGAVASADPKRRGCPADADGDGIADLDDACPAEQGAASPDASKRGCPAGPPASAAPPPPADADGDGLLDNADACPHEKGPASDDKKSRGCPKRVRVNDDIVTEVVLLEPVAFRISRADPAPIDPRSEPVLEELSEVIAQHPEWLKIEVQAHTDNTGNAKYNEGLSTARAESVAKWLVSHGVAAERLVAKGYGGSRPVGDNATAAGREKNRRVNVFVVEKK